MRRLCPALAAAVVLATAGIATPSAVAEPPSGSPVAFLTQVVRLLAANRYAEAWPLLNAEQQATASRRAYVACEGQSPIPGHLVSLRVLYVRHETVHVVPDQPPVASTAVTFVLRIAGAAVPSGVRIVLSAHAVATGSRWSWILPPARLRLYRDGCGSERIPRAARGTLAAATGGQRLVM